MHGAGRLNDVQSRRLMQNPYDLYLADAAAEDEQMLREKREWAEADAKSAKLKDEGNTAFKNEDCKEAYVITDLYGLHVPIEPRTTLSVEQSCDVQDGGKDATDAMEKGDFNRAKALFRRAQGRSFLGDWVEAEEDYAEALALQPRERNIVDGFEELKRLRSLPVDKQAACISEQAKLALLDPFEGEVKRKDASKRCWVTACHSHRWKVDDSA
ncbi:hypothetical protein C8F04DRAFT_1186278 [Mycena alexandri]|uniref:Uncharacterized protein n=1 Tax=Mycena alexandri TaxID=1745969 RepID=A0AAD6SSJ3_9AGAR|nr:hypothetical protein C8F04DRAFT_1186278 [Mycena alexandri]